MILAKNVQQLKEKLDKHTSHTHTHAYAPSLHTHTKGVNSYMGLFTDDAKLIRKIESKEDCEHLQRI